MRAWSPTQCLGDLFVGMSAYLKTYTEYVKNFDVSLRRVADCAAKNPKFETFLRSTEESDGVRTPLEALLITPVQRIPRYVLLLQQLHEHTPLGHPDYEYLQKAIVQIKDVAIYINEKKRESDNALRVVEIQSLLTGKAPNIIAAQRRFCREGELSIQSRSGKKKKRRYWFLFNDIILCTKPLYITTIFSSKRKFKYQLFIALHGADILDQENSDMGFILRTSTHDYSMYADNPEQKVLWMEAIRKALDVMRSSERFYEERASKIAQEKAKEARAFITNQYSTMRDLGRTQPPPIDRKQVVSVPVVSPRKPQTRVDDEPQTEDEKALSDFLAKGGQKGQFAELLRRLVFRGNSEPVRSPKLTTSKDKDNNNESRISFTMLRRNSNASNNSSGSSTSSSPSASPRASQFDPQSPDSTPRKLTKAKSISEVVSLKVTLLQELSEKCKSKRTQ